VISEDKERPVMHTYKIEMRWADQAVIEQIECTVEGAEEIIIGLFQYLNPPKRVKLYQGEELIYDFEPIFVGIRRPDLEVSRGDVLEAIKRTGKAFRSRVVRYGPLLPRGSSNEID
jgi:hypothetical protein